jgi:putative endonuclease
VAGLVPATTTFLPEHRHTGILPPMAGWVYIMTNRRNGTLYVGATVDLARRVWGIGRARQMDLQSNTA